MSKKVEEVSLSENLEEQLRMQGVASYRVDDGEVFVFTKETLETLLESARERGRVIVFVQTPNQIFPKKVKLS